MVADTRPNALAELLQLPTPTRRAIDYELVYDDFIRFSGGQRIGDIYEIPPKVKNPDYHLVTEKFDLVIELKQMNTYRKEQTAEAWFNRLIRDGRYRGGPLEVGDKIVIEPDSFTPEDWRRFYRKFRPSVTDHLDEAARQLKASDVFLPAPRDGRPRLYGAVMLNSNDFNLPTDLLHRLVEWRVKDKWKRGLYSRLDFVISTGVDLAQEGRHPQHSRHVVRSLDMLGAEAAIRFMFDRWIHYGADAVGAEVVFEAGGNGVDPIKTDTQILGKLHWSGPDK